jgi:aldehyde dehydrogenase (NAD+)
VFGPVLAITKFATDDDAIAIANGTPYGLASYIQTHDLTRAHHIAAELEAGQVLINGAATSPCTARSAASASAASARKAAAPEFLRVKAVAIATS